MTYLVASLAAQQPSSSREAGRALPRALRIVRRALLVGPAPAQLFLRRAAARLTVGRLPGLRRAIPTGGSLPWHGTMYSPIFFYGEYEPAESAIVRALLSPGGFALDIGAHRGWFTILMGRAVAPGGRVLAVEPLAPSRCHLSGTSP